MTDDWFKIIKEDYFQDYRKNIKLGIKIGKRNTKRLDIIIQSIEKVLEEPGVNPELKSFARQPFESKVKLIISRRLNLNVGIVDKDIRWGILHKLLNDEFNMRIDGANKNNCGEIGRIGKYGGKCGGPTSGGEGSSVIIYMHDAETIFGDDKPVPKPEPEPEPIRKPGAKYITSGNVTIEDSGDWEENLRRIRAAKRKKRAPGERATLAFRRGGTSGYGGSLRGPGNVRGRTIKRSSPGRCHRCQHLRAVRNIYHINGKPICKACLTKDERKEVRRGGR